MTESKFEPEIRCQEMLDKTTAMFAAVSNDFVFLYANAAYADQWGKQPADLIGKPVKEILGADGFEQALDSFVDAISGQSVEYESEFSVGARTLVTANRLEPFYGRDEDAEKIEGFYVFSSDATGKRVSQQTLSLILAGVPARICLVDDAYQISYSNRRFHDDFNHGGQPKGSHLQDVIREKMWKLAKPNIELALGGDFVRYVDIPADNDITEENQVVYLIPDRAQGTSGVNGVYCLIFNEAQLNLDRQRLRRRERNVDLVLQGQMVGIWESDPEIEDQLLSEHIEKMLGLSVGELANSQSQTFKRIHPDDLPGVLRNRQLYQRSGKDYVNEFRMRDHSGEYRWLRSIGRAELDANGKVVYLAGTVADINELKTAELLAAEQVKHRDSFLSMLSHELRNPIAAIKYALDVFQQPGQEPVELPENIENSIAIISRQTSIISRLLKDLLNVNRIKSNEILFENASVCLVKLVREIAEVSAPRLTEKDQVFSFSCAPQEFTIQGDGVRLHQVFVNLLDNASKYSPEQTEVNFSCSIDSETGDFVAVVSDQGQGIKAKAQRSIFELFFQEDPTLDRSAGGLGVGLYLVKRIVEAHDGTVSVVSPGVNGGSDFEVRLPRERRSATSASDDQAASKRRRLVLVEDNDDSRVALTMALSARNFEVQAFADGETAASKLPTLRPEVALIDIGLPRMDGMSLATELRQHEELNDMLFIALTGYGQDHEHEAIMAAGFDHHLVKPLDLDDLFKIVAEHFA